MIKDDIFFNVIIGMTIGLFIFVAFVKPIIDCIYPL